jgi:methyl-accepting chemotaxis protein
MLTEIVESVRKMDTLVAEIATASGEQSTGIEQVTKAMTEMDKVTQANAAGAEESASSAHELAAQSNQLRDSVDQLNAFTGLSVAKVATVAPVEVAAPTRAPVASAKLAAPKMVKTSVAKPGAAASGDQFWQ